MQRDLLKQLQDEIRQLDSDIMVEEARLGDFKRQTTKDWMALKFGGLVEFAEKALVRRLAQTNVLYWGLMGASSIDRRKLWQTDD